MIKGLMFLTLSLCLINFAQAEKPSKLAQHFERHTPKSIPMTKSHNAKICLGLVKQADTACYQKTCGNFDESQIEECMQDEAGTIIQNCTYKEALPKLISDYNKLNPKKQIDCQDVEL